MRWGAARVAGLALLLVSSGAALALSLDHFGALWLPGCGAGRGCAEAAASAWARVPGVNWPTAFLGLAYFLGLLAIWLTVGAGVPAALRQLVRLGVLISLGYLAIMTVERRWCPYCLAAHAGNLGFWIVVERGRRAPSAGLRALATVTVVFVVASGALGLVEWGQRRAVAVAAEQELTASIGQLTAAGAPAGVSSGVSAAPDPQGAAPSGETERAAPRPATGQGFSGRYRLGPERAAIRIVTFSDYQCPVCRQIEKDIEQVLQQRRDVSFSFKHFPRNSDCNRKATTQAHRNACWAARAAEAAGMLRGSDGFWQMHFWLFENHGSFTAEKLREALRGFGYDPDEFTRLMTAEQTLERVRQDVEEAVALGIYQTPTIFINGVELRGWNAPRAIARAVGELAATNPPALTAEHDRPPAALEKLIGDWRAEQSFHIPVTPDFRSSGPPDATVRVVIFGDYQHDGTAQVDAVLRRELAARRDLRYEFRYFPFNKDCNPVVATETKYPHACRAAQAAEAAGRLGGAAAYWKLHAWLMENQRPFDDAALQAAAGEVGISVDGLLAEMAKAEVAAAVVEDARLGQRCKATAVPTVFVNGRKVAVVMHEGQSVLPQIIEAAAAP